MPIPTAPGQQWAVDHLILTRPTVDGHTAIIVFIDAFSKWPVIRLVKSTSALHAAEAFVEGVISVFGLSPTGTLTLNSDKGSAFISLFFKTVCKLLGVRLITSASQISTSNGAAESLVKSTKQGIKMFADNDVELRAAIPLIELSLRSQPSTVTKLSPFEIVMGRKMSLPIIGNDPVNNNFQGDQFHYLETVTKKLAEIHEGVRQNITDAKDKDERQYNARHKAETPNFTVGMEVLITDRKIKPHSNHVLTRPRYYGSYFITDIVQNEGFGPSYRLTRVSDGKVLKSLISGSRLRVYTAPERQHFYAKYPPLTATRQPDVRSNIEQNANTQTDSSNDKITSPTTVTQTASTSNANDSADQNTNNSEYEPAIKILRERTTKGKKEYLVLFANKQTYWADRVTPQLLKHYRVMQERQRSRRRNRRKRAANDNLRTIK